MITHPLLKRQITKHTKNGNQLHLKSLFDDISIAYQENDRDRSRTDHAIKLMVEELEEANGNLTDLLMSRTDRLKTVEISLEAMLQNSEQGVFIIDENDHVQLCNERAMQLLDIPHELIQLKPKYQEILNYHYQNGEFIHMDLDFLAFIQKGGLKNSPPIYERRRPDGTHLEVRTVLLKNGGAFRVFSDISERKKQESAIESAEKQIRSLFDNTLVGLYRARIDGKITNINKILCQTHGFHTTEDFLQSSNHDSSIIRNYLDQNKHEEFKNILLTEGKVVDFISEIHNEFTGTNVWISETAWLIKDDKGHPTHFDGTITDITERINNQSRISYLALHDTLTGLPNRAYLQDRLEEIVKNTNDNIAVHFLDLDRFKFVNDTLGHAIGDELLKQVAKRLSLCIRTGDFIARLGGDEFAIIQTSATCHKDMEALAKRVIKTVAGTYKLGRHKAHIGTSIGISCIDEVGTSSADLLKTADAALYRAKADGKGIFRFFDPQINAEMLKKITIENDLRFAIKKKQMLVAYQPIINLKTGKLYGFEALVRWKHPVHGFISPDVFISIAEECGEIDKIGEFVLSESCRQIANSADRLNISINVSAVQLRNYHFMNMVVQTLEETRLLPSQLTLEITETALITNAALTREIITGLQNLGVKIALDDFGSGNASLSYLQKYKFDKIKIDRSYISGTDNPIMNKAMLNAVMSLGRDLSIAIVAEGIETNEQHEKIAGYGCDFGQGYLYGKPKFAEEFAELNNVYTLEERRRA